MKKTFLCSYFAETASILSEFVSVPLRGRTVTLIPIASIHEAYMQYMEEARVAFNSPGPIVKELEITQCSKNEIEEVLISCDCIHVPGGNTFSLLQELRRTGIDRCIVEQVEQGKPHIGEFAGVMILVPNIEYAKGMDDCYSRVSGMEDLVGLGPVEFYPVVHFGSFPFEKATREVVDKNSHLLLKIITNQQVTAVVGNNIVIKERK